MSTESSHVRPTFGETAVVSDADDLRVVEALEEYLRLAKSGVRISRTEFLARHSDVADELAECIDGLEFVRSAAGGLPSHHPAAAAEEGLSSGTRLGDFRIVREVGRGGMGIVYEAEQLSLGRRVALKVLPFASAVDHRQRQRFQLEAQAAAQLQHAHIVPIHAVGTDRGIHYYAMQFIDGQTVAALIRELRRPGCDFARALSSRYRDPSTEPTGPYPEIEPISDDVPTTCPRGYVHHRTVAELGRQAAEGLEHAHRLGILHRDVKPANLMVDGGGHLWITDFGLARISDEVGVTRTGDLLGTLRYMSPEQALGRGVLIDERTDVYSLGVTLYELLTLRPAFDAVDRHLLLQQVAQEEPIAPTRIDRSIPRDLETIVLKAMAKDATCRYPNAKALAADLGRFLKEEPILARRPGLVERSVKWSKRHRTALITTLVVMMLGLPTATTLLWLEKRETDTALEAVKTSRQRERELLRLTYDISDEMTMRAMSMVSTLNRAGTGESYAFYVKALEFYEKIVAQTEGDHEMRIVRAQAFKQLGQIRMNLHRGSAGSAFRESIAIFDQLHAERPRDAHIVQGLVRALEQYAVLIQTNMGIDEATPAMRRAIEVQRDAFRARPTDSTFLLGMTRSSLELARSLEGMGRAAESEAVHAELIEEFRKIPIQVATSQMLLRELGNAMVVLALEELDQNRIPASIFIHQLGLILSPESPYLLNSYAWTLVFQPSVLGPCEAACMTNLALGGGSGVLLNNPQAAALEALAMADQAVSLQPRQWEFIHTKGVALYRLGRWEQSIETLNESMNLRQGGDANEWLFIAMNEAKRGDMKAARRWYDRATTWINLGKGLADDGQLRLFRSEADAVLGRAKEPGELGRLFKATGRDPVGPGAGDGRPEGAG